MSSGPQEGARPLRLRDAVDAYLAALPAAEREAQRPALYHFVRWAGDDRELQSLTPVDLERYQEQLGQVSPDATRRLESLRAFLGEARRHRWLKVNLAVHIKTRRKAAAARNATASPTTRVELTRAGLEALQRELERLEQEVRPQLTETLQRAAADKDFRENAPYHAAKQQLAEVQSRINALRATLAAATVVERSDTTRVGLGTRVVLRDLDADEEVTYTLVGPGEINARQGRISIQSPVGRALVDHAAGDIVEVDTPAGIIRYRIERIEAAG
ncbi:MAG TPA: transcription elongation factor GreA [Chloroflexota bacterium]|nr:transcription elongation factor GreA [Chloroflexota bacterium]